MKETAKRLAATAGMLAVMSATAVPAFAQETAAGYQYGGDGGPAPGSSATFTYELTVECEPPADAEFLGFTATESLVTTPL
ncbi:MAG: hypothetical protein M3N18_07850, partial [Actinomycetota bacterium]|nr:hypothetical protein [Actinomycetota bacterium]